MLRSWYKTVVGHSGESGRDRDHLAELSHDSDRPFPKSKDEFFERYLGEFHGHRLAVIRDLLESSLSERDNILSLASGNFAIELALIEKGGRSILCSDQKSPPWLENTRALFPNLQFTVLDPLHDGPEPDCSAILCLGLTYLLDLEDVRMLFRFSFRSLRAAGRLYIDFNVTDSPAVRFYHDIFLPAEGRVVAFLRSVRTARRHSAKRVFHGYHHDLAVIMQIAKDEGFTVENILEGGFDVDFRRSAILNRVMHVPGCRTLLRAVGRLMPYERIAILRRT